MAQQNVSTAVDVDYRTKSSSLWDSRLGRFARENGAFLIMMTLIILLWEGYVRLMEVPVYILPAPTVIVERMIVKSDQLLEHSAWTLYEILVGFFIGMAVGIPIAISIVYSKLAEKTIFSLVVSMQAIPKIALVPLLIAWFGFNQMPKLIITFLICFFPIVVSTVVGLRSMPVEMFHLARSIGASGWEIFWKFRLPHGLPNIFAGLKMAISLAVIGAVVGEYTAGNNGLGYLQIIVASNLDIPMVFAILVVLSLIAIVLFHLIGAIESWVIRWDPSRQIEQAKER